MCHILRGVEKNKQAKLNDYQGVLIELCWVPSPPQRINSSPTGVIEQGVEGSGLERKSARRNACSPGMQHAYGTNARYETRTILHTKHTQNSAWPSSHTLGLADEGHTPHRPSLARPLSYP